MKSLQSLKTIAACTFLILLGSLLPYSYKGVSAQSKIDINQDTKGVLVADRLGGGPYLPEAGGTMTGPIVGNTSFVDSDYSATTSGLSLSDAAGNQIHTGLATNYGNMPFVALRTKNNQAFIE